MLPTLSETQKLRRNVEAVSASVVFWLLPVLKGERSLALPPVRDGVGGSQHERLCGRDHDETAARQL